MPQRSAWQPPARPPPTAWLMRSCNGQDRRRLSTFVPWSMRDKKGDLIGFEIDVSRQLAADMAVDVEFVPTAFDGIIPALLAKKFDVIITGMVIKPQRNLTVNFSDPYAYLTVGMAANKKMADELGLSTLEDWNSSKVTLTIKRGTAPGETAARLFPRRGCASSTTMPRRFRTCSTATPTPS